MPKKGNISFCFRCYHDWKRRRPQLPKVCPKCKSPYWSKPRKRVDKGFILKMTETVINVHDAIIRLSGGTQGIRDQGGVYNSVYKLLNHQNKNKNKPISIGAFALNEFSKRHYFTDGNKRTAYVIAKIFMLINNCHLKSEYSNTVSFILKIADYNGKLSFEEIKSWLGNKCNTIEGKNIGTYLNQVFVDLMLGRKDGTN